MDLLVVPVPFFDKNMMVQAYYLRCQEGNGLFEANQAEREFDGAMLSPLLATLNAVGVDAYTMGKPIFVPVNGLMMLTDLAAQCRQPSDRVIFVVDEGCKPEEPFLSNIARLKELGFRFAMQKISRVDKYAPVAALCDYIFFDNRQMEDPRQQLMYALAQRDYRHIRTVTTHIHSQEQFEELKRLPDQGSRAPDLYEGRFYRIPITRGEHRVSPLKLNLIKLLNLVRDENFEFSAVSAIVQRDTALTVSLMRMINSPFLGLRQKVKSIGHAVTILGQVETRKWVTTAVSKLLGADRPDELSRLSLVRAKFADNLSLKFKMEQESQGIFLMGLFSVLDVILEMSMEEALRMVQVSDPIRNALLEGKGDFGKILRFMQMYELADWKAVSRELIVNDLAPEDIYEAYMGALGWYGDVVGGEDVSFGE
ncbi:MAG: HDOD domain-containing protein [Oscillospiraceae bacterium]|nr:HDOD domain-containing protein [Oscillospiraceae bacterium]